MPLANCKDIYNAGERVSGLYRINPNDGGGEFLVFCDMNLQGGGWTVIQRRVNDSTSFNRTRKDYNIGFGNFNGNFWLGLEKIKRLTDYSSSEIYIGMQSFLTTDDVAFQLAWARYGSFSLGTNQNDYQLSISQYSGTAGDSFKIHNGKKFTTSDEDNDSDDLENCAVKYSSGWWYNNCYEAHLNGVYYSSGEHPTSTHDGIIWKDWIGTTRTLQTIVMAIRPV